MILKINAANQHIMSLDQDGLFRGGKRLDPVGFFEWGGKHLSFQTPKFKILRAMQIRESYAEEDERNLEKKRTRKREREREGHTRQKGRVSFSWQESGKKFFCGVEIWIEI